MIDEGNEGGWCELETDDTNFSAGQWTDLEQRTDDGVSRNGKE